MFETGEQLARAFVARWSAHDADGLAALFAEDADFVNVVGFWWRDRRRIRKAHAYGFERIFQTARLEFVELSTRALGPDVEIVHMVVTLDGQTAPDGAAAGRRTTVMSFVTRHAAAGFEIVSAQNTDRVEGADTHIAADGAVGAASYR